MYRYDFRIAGFRLRVNSPYQLEQLYELQNYSVVYNPSMIPDAQYEIQLLPEDWTIQGQLILETARDAVYLLDSSVLRYFYLTVGSKQRYVLLKQNRPDDGRYIIYIQADRFEEFWPRFRLSAFLSLEKFLMAHDAFQLHASVIEWQGSGILFSGPSGIGKSTQANLWNRERGARIINGDRGLIRRMDADYLVYGSPYAGTSGIYTTAQVPIRAIVVLTQAPYEQLRRLKPAEAFAKLYRECTVPAWDPGFAEALTELLADMVSRIPVYHLACRPSTEAVEVLEKELG